MGKCAAQLDDGPAHVLAGCLGRAYVPCEQPIEPGLADRRDERDEPGDLRWHQRADHQPAVRSPEPRQRDAQDPHEPQDAILMRDTTHRGTEALRRIWGFLGVSVSLCVVLMIVAFGAALSAQQPNSQQPTFRASTKL